VYGMENTTVKLNVVVTCPGKLDAHEVARLFKRLVEAGIDEMNDRDLDWQNALGALDHDAKVARDMTVIVGVEK
jgi:hypothetical protein